MKTIRNRVPAIVPLPAVVPLVLAVTLMVTLGWAAPVTWDGDTSVDFEDGDNWVGDAAPLATDTAVFSAATTYQPALSGSRSIYGVEFNGTNRVLGGTGYTLTVGAGGIATTHTVSGTNTVNAHVALGDSSTWMVGSDWLTHNLNLTGNLSSAPGDTFTLDASKWYAQTMNVTGMTSLAGDVILGGPNLKIAGSTDSSMTGNLKFNGGVLMTNADVTRDLGTGVGGVQFASAVGGFTNYGSTPITVTIGDGLGGAADLTWGSTLFRPSAFVLSGRGAGSGGLTLPNAIDLNGGNRQFYNYGGSCVAELTGLITNGGASPAGIYQHNNSNGTIYLKNNSNSFNGRITIYGGKLRFDTIGNIGSGDSALGNPTTAANALITLGNTHSTTHIYTGSLIYSGSADVSTDRPIGLRGNATINSTGTGTITFTADMVPDMYSALNDLARTFTLGGSNTGDNTFGGVILDRKPTCPTSVVKAGAGKWILSGANTYSGITTVSAGTLRITNPSSLGATTGGTVIESGATLDVGAAYASTSSSEAITVSGSGVGGLGAIINTGAAFNNRGFGNVTLVGDTTFGGSNRWDLRSGATFAGNSHTLTKAGTFAMAVSRAMNDVNIVINEGMIIIQNSNALGGSTFGNTVVNSGGTLTYYGPYTVPETIILNGGTLGSLNNDTTFSGPVTLDADSTISTNTGGHDITISGQIDGGGGFTKIGGSDLILSGANSYSGLTKVDAGVVRLAGGSDRLPTNNAVIIRNGATLDLNGQDQTLNRIDNSGSRILLGSGMLTIGNNNAISDIRGSLVVISGTGGLTKIGPNVSYIGGTTTYGGGTFINAGRLGLYRQSDCLPTTGDVTIAGGAVLGLADSGGPANSTQTIGRLYGLGTVRISQSSKFVNFIVGNGGGSSEFYGVIENGNASSTLALTKTGAGTLTLSGANTYTGPTDIDAGTLLVNGTHIGGGDYTVADDATLGGTGALDAAVSVDSGGHVAPGASTGSLEIGDLSMSVDSFFDVEIGGSSAGAALNGYDQLDVSGTVALNGATLNLSLLNGYPPAVGNAFYLLVNDGDDAITGKFSFEGSSLDEGEEILFGSTGFVATYQADWLTGASSGGNDFALMAVPEPSTLVLSALALLGLAVVGGRRRKRD